MINTKLHHSSSSSIPLAALQIWAEITLKNGNKIPTIKPNLNEKVANVLAGIVDLTVRAYMDGQERFIQLEKKENIFGGGRFLCFNVRSRFSTLLQVR